MSTAEKQTENKAKATESKVEKGAENAKNAATAKAPKAEIVLPADNAVQFAASEELKEILSGGKALTGKIVKVKQASLAKLRPDFPPFLHLLPINATRAVAFVWDTREIVEVVDTTNLTSDDFVNRVKDSGLPLRVAKDNKEVLAVLA
jgi:hypothetical protein